jgi:hypothetical protein
VIAALFVQKGGAYWNLPDVDPWDEARDARLYAGPWPVVAHPPCERWGRYWGGGPMLARTTKAKRLGDDGGCFRAALVAVQSWGGVLEHPEASHAWATFRLPKPPKSGGWLRCWDGGWTCCVEQGNYGHRARKATWLYYFGDAPPPLLNWGHSGAKARIDDGFHSKEERRRVKTEEFGTIELGFAPRLSKLERLSTPLEFRDLLLSIARSARAQPKRPEGDLHRAVSTD